MNRRNMIRLSTVTALTLSLFSSASIAQQKSLKDQLVGTWTLVSSQAVKDGVKTDRWGPSPKGRVIFGADGRYSFMIFRSDLPKFAANSITAGTPEENKAVVQGMAATFGTWSVDETTKTITSNVEASSFPNQNGSTQKRIISSITADELKYTNPSSTIGTSDEVVWKRAK
jgi:Lipocalin-like domain